MKNNFSICIILFCLAFAGRIFMFGYPPQFVFDEVYFVNFTSHYTEGTHYFDQHPPLGKLILYSFSKAVGFHGHSGTPVIGENFENESYKYLRILPIFFGSLLAPLIFLLAQQLGMSLGVSLLAGLAIVFENSLVVESRFVLMDSMLIFFGFLGLYLYLRSIYTVNENRLKILSAISLSLCIGIKWTGFAFLGIVGLLELKNFSKSLLIFIFIPIIIYVSSFYIHFKLLPNPGPGDAFMSQDFNQNKLSFKNKFLELNRVMFTANSTMKATHMYESRWYTWPLMKRPVYYWQGKENEMIYLLGNPLIYWFSLFGIGLLALGFVLRKERGLTVFILICGYLANLLPFALISRPMFIYHYLSSLIFAILALSYILDRITNIKIKKYVVMIIAILYIASFLYFSPLTYGLDNPKVMDRFWISSWR